MKRILPVSIALAAVAFSAAARADLPAPRTGFVRVESLGIDVQSPGELEWEEFEFARIDWQGPRGSCLLELAADTDGRADRRLVGTQPVTCSVHGDGCGACGELRPVRGGPAEARYPTEPPAIAIKSAWSDRTRDRAGVLVWRDGTVQFWGAECRGFRGRRRSVPAARVAALVDELVRAGLLEHAAARGERRDPMCEHEVTLLTIRSAARANTIVSTCAPDELTRTALSLVEKTVGPNPCLSR